MNETNTTQNQRAAIDRQEVFRRICVTIAPVAFALMTAHAANAQPKIEVGVGVSQFTTREDGLWYQEGFSHKLDMRSPSISIGLTGDVNSWLSWRASYVYLGNARSSADAVPDATDYPNGVGGYNASTKSCNGACGPMRKFVGRGNLQGVYFTLEPHVTWNGWRFGIEAGPFLYRATWNVDIYNTDGAPQWAAYEAMSYKPRIELGMVAGASVSRGHYSVAYQWFHAPTKWNPVPAIWNNVHMITLRYSF